MPTYQYTAKNQDAATIAGKIAAENKTAVIEELRKRKLTIISVNETREAGQPAFSFERKKVKGDEIVIFARQLATMVEAGIPIIQGIDAMQEQVTQPFFKKVLVNIREDIKTGSSLFAAFAKHPSAFDLLFINMVKVGETGGVLSTVLDRVAGYMEKTLKLKRKVKAALTYPAVVVTMAILITTLLLVKVVPTFASIYESFDRPLPPMTRMLINISAVVKSYILFLIAGIALIIYLLRRWHKTDRGAYIIDGMVLRMPILGDLFRKVAISRFTRTLATLLQSGVPILESLDIVRKTIGNRVLEVVVENVKNAVREGSSIGGPLSKNGIFPPMVTRMITIGEKSGELEKMLLKVSEFYDDQVDAAVEGLSNIIEPVIIGFLGIVVGFIVIALFLPIITIAQIIQ